MEPKYPAALDRRMSQAATIADKSITTHGACTAIDLQRDMGIVRTTALKYLGALVSLNPGKYAWASAVGPRKRGGMPKQIRWTAMIESYFLYLYCQTCNARTDGDYNNNQDEMRRLIDNFPTLRRWLGLNFPLLELYPTNPQGEVLLKFLAIHCDHNLDIASDVPGWELEQ